MKNKLQALCPKLRVQDTKSFRQGYDPSMEHEYSLPSARSHLNPAHILTPYFCKIYSNITVIVAVNKRALLDKSLMYDEEEAVMRGSKRHGQ